MKTQQILLPYVLIGFGILYLLKTDIFHLFLSRRKPVSEQHAMTEGNITFMRVLGTVFVIAGFAILMYGRR
jgi:hypothetical protein